MSLKKHQFKYEIEMIVSIKKNELENKITMPTRFVASSTVCLRMDLPRDLFLFWTIREEIFISLMSDLIF